MDRNILVETLQNEGNLKHSFSAEDIELIAQHMSIETFDKNSRNPENDSFDPSLCLRAGC